MSWKSQLEFEKANYEYKKIEQDVILKSVSAYYDLILKNKSKNLIWLTLVYLEVRKSDDLGYKRVK